MARSRAPQAPAPKSDAYVGLLLISLLAQIAAAVFFYLDWSSYPEAKPKLPSPVSVQVSLPGGGGNPATAGGPAPAAGGPAPMAGGPVAMAGAMAGGPAPMAGKMP